MQMIGSVGICSVIACSDFEICCSVDFVHEMVSDKERILMNKLREMIETKHAPDFEVEDCLISMYLRAGRMDLDKALALYNRSLEVQETLIGTGEVIDFRRHKSLKEISDNIVFHFIGIDVDGNLVLWLPFGRWDFRSHLGKGLRKESALHCLKSIVEICRSLYEEGEKAGRHVNLILLVDFEELSFKKVTHLESIRIGLSFLKDIQVVSKLLSTVYMVNAHWATGYLLTMMKPFISEKMARKLVLMNTDKEELQRVLLEKIPIELLPAEYGGEGEPVLGKVLA